MGSTFTQFYIYLFYRIDKKYNHTVFGKTPVTKTGCTQAPASEEKFSNWSNFQSLHSLQLKSYNANVNLVIMLLNAKTFNKQQCLHRNGRKTLPNCNLYLETAWLQFSLT